jgi:predicted permease
MFFDNFILIAQQVLVLFILIGVGYACGKFKVITEEASKKMTDIVPYVVTPFVMVNAFQREFSFDLLGQVFLAAGIALAILILSILLTKLVFHDKDLARRKVLQFSVVFSNCAFMSLPLQKALLGDEGMFFGSIFVAIFNIVVWTFGLVDMSGDRKMLSAKRLALNPGIIGFVASMIIFVTGVQLPVFISAPISHLANLNTPLPMLIIGYYLANARLKKAFTDLGSYLALALRLIVIPVGVLFAMAPFGINRNMVIAFVIACSAPTAATCTMFSAKFNRDVELSVGVVASSTLLSIVTMPLVVSLAYTVCPA